MIDNLNQNEMEVASNLISDGLTMAKTSMEQILQSSMELKKIDYGNQTEGLPKFGSENTNRTHLIKTALMGQLSGSCYLLFTDEEVEKIYQACIPVAMQSANLADNETMKTDFLKEIDNMVAAAVVTKFSNTLELELFGGVPIAYVFDADKLDEYLASEADIFKTVLHFKANFHCTELNISPDFIWMFSDEFADKIKDIV